MAGDVVVHLGRQQLARRRHEAVGRRQEQRLLGGPAADQGVEHDRLALEVHPAPHLHGAGRLQQVALVQPAQHVGMAEVVEPDVEHEAAEGVELVLAQGRVDPVIDRAANLHEVVDQQRFGVRLGDLGALAGGLGMAVADGPAAVFQPGRGPAIALEALDQIKRGAGCLLARFHRYLIHFGTDGGASDRKGARSTPITTE